LPSDGVHTALALARVAQPVIGEVGLEPLGTEGEPQAFGEGVDVQGAVPLGAAVGGRVGRRDRCCGGELKQLGLHALELVEFGVEAEELGIVGVRV
jgi:hypothetical protein